MLLQPFDPKATAGIDLTSVRVFRWDEAAKTVLPVWNSGVNHTYNFVWAEIGRPGIYVPIGLPRDQFLREVLRSMALARLHTDQISARARRRITQQTLAPLLEIGDEELETIRRTVDQFEIQTTSAQVRRGDLEVGHGGHLLGFALPGAKTLAEVLRRIEQMDIPVGGLPEEALFFAPQFSDGDPWPLPLPFPRPWPLPPPPWPWPWPWPWPRPWPPRPWPPFCWWFFNNWPMYHHDAQHSGHASGCSNLWSTTVGSLTLKHTVSVPGTFITIPSIFNGMVYIGSSNDPTFGGTMYKINMSTGVIAGSYHVTGRFPAYSQGVGGSPAVVGGRVYFTTIPGQVHCLDAATMGLIWSTDLRFPDAAHNQPVNNPAADCWTGPVVAGARVYVGCGEGESDAFGFVYCLDAATGNVIWLFSTNKTSAVADNAPNVIPKSAAVSVPLPAWATGFTIGGDPMYKGVSVWSSPAYDPGLNRIFVGTGNAHHLVGFDYIPLPDDYYGSGVLSLDASTGTFAGFYQPLPGDCYKPTDNDADVPGSPTLFNRGGTTVVAVGTKAGAFVLLNAATMTPLSKRQLLPYDAAGAPLPGVDPHGGVGENYYGTFTTAALHYGLQRIFVGIGGYSGAIDTPTTPFMRALDWNTLTDAWATAVGADGVTRYVAPRPPMYTTPNECGLSSPAVANNVVFMATTRPALYALNAANGICLWSAPGLLPTPGTNCLGPAISGNAVVIGVGSTVYIYSL